MRAAILAEVPGKLFVDDVTLDAPGPDEVLVRVAACGLCHSDVHVLDAHLPAVLPTVLGHEAGGVGLNIVQGARIAGAERIVAVDRQAAKLDLARTFGATDTVDASTTDPVADVVERTGGGVDHAFEAVGLAATIGQAFEMARPG